MDSLPKNAAGKILRIKLDKRFQLNNVDDTLPPSERLYEATAPPVGASLSTLIPIKPIKFDLEKVASLILKKNSSIKSIVVAMMDLPLNKGCITAIVNPRIIDVDTIRNTCLSEIDSHMVPVFIMSVDSFPYTDKQCKQPFKLKYSYGLDSKQSLNDDLLRHIVIETYSSEKVCHYYYHYYCHDYYHYYCHYYH